MVMSDEEEDARVGSAPQFLGSSARWRWATAWLLVSWLCLWSGAPPRLLDLRVGGLSRPAPDGDLRASQARGGRVPSPTAPKLPEGRTGPAMRCWGVREVGPLGSRRVRRRGRHQTIRQGAMAASNYRRRGHDAGGRGQGARGRGLGHDAEGVDPLSLSYWEPSAVGGRENFSQAPRGPRRGCETPCQRAIAHKF